MRKDYTDITFVLDRSGSMQSVKTDTIGGFNQFLEDQKKVPGKATFTLNQFDDQFERVFDGLEIGEVPALDDSRFVPRGMTALLDAIGHSIRDTGTRLEAMPEAERPEKVVVAILTDGLENKSMEETYKSIESLIEHHKNKYSWEFVFLGANQDAIKVAQGIGINVANAMTYAHNKEGTVKAFSAFSENLTSYRSGTTRSMSWKATDREDQEKAGVTPTKQA